jgi:hypothetical protein
VASAEALRGLADSPALAGVVGRLGGEAAYRL